MYVIEAEKRKLLQKSCSATAPLDGEPNAMEFELEVGLGVSEAEDGDAGVASEARMVGMSVSGRGGEGWSSML